MTTTYPFALDDDSSIQRVDDNLTQIGQDVINALRSATFALESALGLQPNGSKGSLADRINQSLNPDGSIKASALTSIGLVTLPITNSQVASNAGILETKLSLAHTTSDLYSLIQVNSTLLNSLSAFLTATSSNLNGHVGGAAVKLDGTSNRHVASHIDLNSIPSDSRDVSFVWSGLVDKTGSLRSAVTVAQAILQINNDLVGHENATSGAHLASAITIDTSKFIEIPPSVNDAQDLANYIDTNEFTKIGEHRSTQHSNGIAPTARVQAFNLPDGYGLQVVPPTAATSYLVRSPAVSPVDSISNGDDLIRFVPSNTGFNFDAAFRLVQVGDTIHINYGNGVEASFPVESVRYIPGSEWVVRINGTNLYDSADGYALARIDRSRADSNTSGILAVAAANATPSASFSTILSGLIVGDPRAAGALGLGFDPGQLDSTHYSLWLEFYPTGNPSDRIIQLPAIDVTGNAGITPGKYTLSSVVQATNNSLRSIGYNLRLMAYQYNGEFGIKMTDSIGGAGFAIIKGVNSAGTLTVGTYSNNVIAEINDTFDALGLGVRGSDQASPAYQSSYTSSLAAQYPTKVLLPVKNRNYIANGQKRDSFNPTYLANKDGYWDGYIAARVPVGAFTVETTYHIYLDLKAAGLKPGKSITIQPSIPFTDARYADVDYGRFIIKSVFFPPICPGVPQATEITVINGLHATGNGFGFSSGPTLPVRLYFGSDSVGFDAEDIIDISPSVTQYRRHHEVFIDQTGRTFSHERARLPLQVEDTQPSWLGTGKFHIREVSKKLRGYRDASPTLYNKYVRFYVTSYNASTGEYDGYLGQRFSAADTNITSVGPLTRGRKNQTIRFFDETYVDYIDIEYQEEVSPGTSILSTAAARFVDIEVFPSLRNDQEFFHLANTEVNWTPAAGNDIVQTVIDKRNFGTIDENCFTDSALLALSAGDRWLHQNGIVRGFALDSISSVANSGEIFFKGGLALVNGRMVATNNNSVTIPKVYPTGSSLPQTLNWAIVVNERGNLEAFILTSSKQQYFATIGASNWYVPSFTFQELIDTKKNVTVIAVANVTVASLTVNSVNDVRRIILNGTASAPLTWAGDNQEVANFQSITSLKNWISYYSSVKNRVKVIGTLSIDSTVDLTGFTREVVIDGSEAIFNVNVTKGFLLGSNVTLDSCTFNYNIAAAPFAALSMVAGDEINTGNGCLYGAGGTDLSHVTIRNCTFTTLRTTQRPPFINLELNKGQVNDQIKIIDNQFLESTPSSETQAIVAIVQLYAGVSSNPAVLSNSLIARNICSHKQGIYVTTISGLLGPLNSSPIPGINSVNSFIRENSCGKIGFMTSALPNSLASQTQVDRQQGLFIEKNTCIFIGNVIGNSYIPSTGSFQYATGPVVIDGNRCSWIYFNQNEDYSNFAYCMSKISNNYLAASDSTFLIGSLPNYAIMLGDDGNYNYQTQVVVTGNLINYGRFDGVTYGYNIGISNCMGAIISHNIIKGLNTSGIGIDVLVGGSAQKRCNISNNQIYRGTTSIANYIRLETSSTDTEGFCVDNYFDSTTINGSTATTIATPSGSWIVERNKNQTATMFITAATATTGIRDATQADPNTAGTLAAYNASFTTAARDFTFHYGNTGTELWATWIVPLSVLPKNAQLISASSVVVMSNTTPTTKKATMYFTDEVLGVSASSTVNPLTAGNQTLTNSTAGYSSSPSSGGYIVLEFDISGGSVVEAYARIMNITYRW